MQPRFDTLTYCETWARVKALADALANNPVHPGDRVATLGFTSADYAVVDMALSLTGAVAVPLQTSAPVTQLHPILVETEPVAILSSVDHLADAVELALTAHAPQRLVVFDYHPQIDDHREAFEAAVARLADLHVTVETLDDVIARGAQHTDGPEIPRGRNDDLRLLIYTSGSTGTPKGAMYTDRLMAKTAGADGSPPTGTPRASCPRSRLNFMPISHVMGRVILYSTLGAGGTAYFAAKSDLSTLLDDLALVRPTKLDLVPRIWEMLFQEIQSEVDRRMTDGADRDTVETPGDGRAARETHWRTPVLGDDGLRAHLARNCGPGPRTSSTSTSSTATAPPRTASSWSTTRCAAHRCSTTSWSTCRSSATSPPTARIPAASCTSSQPMSSPATTSGPRSRPSSSTPTAGITPAT